LPSPESTCWTEIRAAAAGGAAERQQFARRYDAVIRAYLAARWRGAPLLQDLDDAAQEVFVACFRPGGLLERADPDRPGGFRAFLYGAARNVARRFEERRGRAREQGVPAGAELEELARHEAHLSRVFDRAWAEALVREAAARQEAAARVLGPEAVRRVELLRLRFQDGLPIREIARLWGTDAADLHHEYARARTEFYRELREVVAFHRSAGDGDLDRACADLLQLLA
jgi:RNA polymerase sigma factor (sigma-70 family)